MSKEEISQEQKENSQKNLDDCKQSFFQSVAQISENCATSINMAVRKKFQDVVQIPVNTINNIEETIDNLVKAVSIALDNCQNQPSSPQYDPKKDLDEINSLLQPIEEMLNTLQIPCLNEIKELLVSLNQMLEESSEDGLEERTDEDRPKLPAGYIETLMKLKEAVIRFCIEVPIKIQGLLLDAVALLAKKIEDLIGAILPEPIPTIIKIATSWPKLSAFIKQFPVRVTRAVIGIIKQQLHLIGQVMDESNKLVTTLGKSHQPCPQRKNNNEKAKDESEQIPPETSPTIKNLKKSEGGKQEPLQPEITPKEFEEIVVSKAYITANIIKMLKNTSPSYIGPELYKRGLNDIVNRTGEITGQNPFTMKDLWQIIKGLNDESLLTIVKTLTDEQSQQVSNNIFYIFNSIKNKKTFIALHSVTFMRLYRFWNNKMTEEQRNKFLKYKENL